MAIPCKEPLPLLRGRPQGSEGGERERGRGKPRPYYIRAEAKTMQVGDISVWERTFTEEDVRLFTRVSGDQGIQHMQPDEQGRLQVHGLLTATLPTKLGGDMNYIARQMVFDFLRPVFTG